MFSKMEKLIINGQTFVVSDPRATTLYVTVTAAEDGTLTADKTFAEVKAAYDSKRTVVGMMDGYAAPVSFVADNCIEFSCFLEGTYTKGQLLSDNTVSVSLSEFPNVTAVSEMIDRAITALPNLDEVSY